MTDLLQYQRTNFVDKVIASFCIDEVPESILYLRDQYINGDIYIETIYRELRGASE
jgi:hypothetical protein